MAKTIEFYTNYGYAYVCKSCAWFSNPVGIPRDCCPQCGLHVNHEIGRWKVKEIDRFFYTDVKYVEFELKKDADYPEKPKVKPPKHDPEEKRYLMCGDQPAQIDCRNEDCFYHVRGNCINESPAISLLTNGRFNCWSRIDKEKRFETRDCKKNPTVNINGLGAKDITFADETATNNGDILTEYTLFPSKLLTETIKKE
jgi:hypothetical protein